MDSRRITKVLRSPTLETVKMVERVIELNSGEFKKTQIWEILPRKVMWPTFTIVLDYLEEINKIAVSEDGVITYIWNPKLINKLVKRKNY